jgi:hypothetical protein
MANLPTNTTGGMPRKKAFGLYGNIYSYPNYGQYRPRFYSLQDSEQGLDALSRELLVRWSREASAQLPFVDAAIRIKAQFTIGNAYQPEYVGKKSAWGKEATAWLKDVFFPNPTTRGYLNWHELLHLESTTIDQDGDFLCVYGRDKDGLPKVQLIPTHRVRSFSNDGLNWTEGPIPNTILADGVVYEQSGRPIGYNVVNYDNQVNQIVKTTDNRFISSRDAQLVFDPRFFDKGRGRPAIGSAILQALSLQEIDTYLLEKIKLSSMLGWIEKTPSGEGPMELEETSAALNAGLQQFGVYNPSPNVHAVEIVQGVTNRFIKAEGGDIKMMDSNTPQDETKNYITRMEQQILSVIGVPHQLVYSADSVSGRVSDGVAKIFTAGIERQQAILDKHAKFMIGWALASAIKAGELPENNDESLVQAFEMTHPTAFSLNDRYDHKTDLEDLAAGVKSLNDITKKRGKTASEVMEEQEKEAIELLTRANRVAKETGTDVSVVLSLMRDKAKAATMAQQPVEISKNEE